MKDDTLDEAGLAAVAGSELSFAAEAVAIGTHIGLFDVLSPVCRSPAGRGVYTQSRVTEVADDGFHDFQSHAEVAPRTLRLSEQQQKAYDTVLQHVGALVDGHPVPQMLLLISGQAGSGKTLLVNALSAAFKAEGISGWLVKVASTGTAAGLIGGQTFSSWGVPVTARRYTMTRRTSIVEMVSRAKDVRYVFIDHASYLSNAQLFLLSQSFARLTGHQSGLPFGGLNVVICADLHQTSPPFLRTALYHDQRLRGDAKQGRDIFYKFESVINLESRARGDWASLLGRIRRGRCTAADLVTLRGRLAASVYTGSTMFSIGAWTGATMITTRGLVADVWNDAALVAFAARAGHHVYLCTAFDTIVDRFPTPEEQFVIASTGNAPLLECFRICVGMPILVIMAGSTVFADVVDIVLDKRESLGFVSDGAADDVVLRFLPTAILFRPKNDTRPSVFSIKPVKAHFTREFPKAKSVVVREQFPIKPAFALTTVKAEGLQFGNVVVDIGKPPTGRVGVSAAYSALAKAETLDNVILLRDFHDSTFMDSICYELQAHEDRVTMTSL